MIKPEIHFSAMALAIATATTAATAEPQRVQVGDMVFKIPGDLKVDIWRKKMPPPGVPYDEFAEQVGGATIYGPSAWKISGTHRSAGGHWEYSRVQIGFLSEGDPLVSDSWCRKGIETEGKRLKSSKARFETSDFYVFGEDNKIHGGTLGKTIVDSSMLQWS